MAVSFLQMSEIMNNENSCDSIAIQLEKMRYEYGGIDKMPPDIAENYKSLQEKLAAEKAPALKEDAESGVVKLLLWPAMLIGALVTMVIFGLAIGVVHHRDFLEALSTTNAGRIIAYEFIDAARGNFGQTKSLFLIISSAACAAIGVYDLIKARYCLIIVICLYVAAMLI